MKRMLLALAALYPCLNATPAEAGFGCANACSITNGNSCVSQGLGCNPALMACQFCLNDLFCQPGGTCNQATGECIIDCNAVDGGVVDGGLVDVGPGDAVVADTGDTGGEAGVMDAMPPMDTGAVDTGVGDMGPPDNGVPDFGQLDAMLIDKGPGGGRPPLDPNRSDNDDCQCSNSTPTNNGWWLTALLGFVVVARRRRQA